jgi:tRNA 2-thiouridine synthesizing protein A
LPPDTAATGAVETLDCRGLKCPLPVLRMEKRLAAIGPGAGLVVLATDPMAKIDIPLHCRQHGHTCTLTEAEGVLTFAIVKAG